MNKKNAFYNQSHQSLNRGFTLIEILLVVAAIAILAGIVILAINPLKQLAETRNAQRKADVNTISNAVYQYAIDTGTIPTTITASPTEICKTDSVSCTGLVDLSVLTDDEKYIVAIPQDPNGDCDENGVCYEISRTVNNRIIVSAPDAEQGETINITR